MPRRSSSTSVSSTFDEGLVHHLRTTNCSKFTALVNMHLSILLDLSGTCLSELIEDHTSATSATEQTVKAPAIGAVFSKKKQGKGICTMTRRHLSECLRVTRSGNPNTVLFLESNPLMIGFRVVSK